MKNYIQRVIVTLILMTAWCMLNSVQAQTPYYHKNRTFTPVEIHLEGVPTLEELNAAADKLTDIVQGTIKLNTNGPPNGTFAIEKQAAIPICYGSALSAWNAAVNYTGSTTNYLGKTFDNVGWVRGTKSVNGDWGAYLWVLQNRIAFQSSTSAWWTTTNGIAIAITNVMVGSLGDYGPVSDVVDIGPSIPTNYPGANQHDVGIYQVDITNVCYQLSIPDIWITPRDAVACVGDSNVQFAVTGTNIPSGVTWKIIPEGVGATIQSAGDWHHAEVNPGDVATNYKVRATSVDNANFYDQVDLELVRVVIDNYTTVTYDGLDSLPLVCRIEPEGITPLSYTWSATWPSSATNKPQVTFENPTGQVTRISNTHWYSMTPPPGTFTAAFYNIYCTVQFNGMSCSNATPATSGVDVYEIGGQCDPPDHTGHVNVNCLETNDYFMVTSVENWERIAPVISNAYTLNSQFYPKVQAHEEKHESDFNNGYEGHIFYQKAEFEPMVIGLTNSTLEGIKAMVTEELDWYLEDEDTEIWNVDIRNEMEDRAYQVSDAWPPFYIYQRGGL